MPIDSTQTELPPSPGDRIGRWLLGEVLGVGGMATVYAATGPNGEEVAVKVLHPGKTDQDEARRFHREFITLRGLRHPAIVSVYEAGRAGDYPWIAMERIPGTDLETLSRRWASHPPSNRHALAEGIFRDLCEALAHVHATGLIHRDLKPSNVLITPTYRAKLTDFGVVKAPFGQFQTQLTAIGSLVGTAAYMAPEQISGDPVDGRSDLYSLGAVFYVLLTGQRPIVADSVAGYLTRHLTESPRDPRELDREIPARLAHICLRLLAKDPAQRYASAELVVEALSDPEDQHTREAHGREAELEAALHLLETVADGRGGLAIVEGPPGSGRSTFLRKVAEQARALGHGISLASATEPDLLDRLCAQVPSLGPTGSASTAVDRIAERTRGRSWTFLIDDLHAASTEVLAEISRLLRQQVTIEGEPLLVMAGTHAPTGEVGTLASGATTSLQPQRIVLRPLELEPTERLLRDLGVVGAPCTTLAARLCSDGQAWPGTIAERVEALVRERWFHRDIDGILRLDRSLEDLRSGVLPLPSDSQNALARAVHRLDTATRTTLDALVILDGESDPQTLCAVTGLGAATVESGAQQLEQAGFVQRDTVGLHTVLRVHPKHPVPVLYGLIETASRARLHRAVATALQSRRGRTPPGVIATHLLGGEQPGAALPLFLRAAATHLRVGRLSEASRFLSEASRCQDAAELELPEKSWPPLRRELAVLEAELHERSGEESLALEAWNRALEAATAETNASAMQRAQAGIGSMYAALEDGRAVATLAPVWKKMARGAPQWPQTTKALGRSLLAAGRGSEARKVWAQLKQHAEDAGLAGLLAEAELGAALVRVTEGAGKDAREALHHAEQLLRGSGADGRSLSACILLLAHLAHARGALLAASERASEVLRIPGASPLQQAEAAALLVHCADADSSLPSAAALLDRLLKQAQEQTDPHIVSWLTRAAAARALLTADRATEAQSLLSIDNATLWSTLEESREPGLTDPSGQVQALRSRLTPDPDLATAEAWSALGRDLPAYPWAAARIAIDAAYGLVHAGDPSAEEAIMEALDRTVAPELALHRLEAATLGARVGLVPQSDLEALSEQVQADSGEVRRLGQRWK